MNDMATTNALRAELGVILTRLRRRWRARRALLGTVWFLAAFAGVALIGALAVDAWRFAPAVVGATRVVSYIVCAGSLLYFVALPIFQRVTDRRLALYVEEHEPSLAMALASATEIADRAGDGNAAVLERGLLEHTVNACHGIADGRGVDAAKLRRNGLLAALSIATILLIASLLPPNLRQASQLVFFPPASSAFVNPYGLIVEPGDVLVSRGAEQLIVARTQGFEPQQVALLTRFGDDEWQRAAMIPGGDSHSFELFLFDLARSAEYQVVTQGLRSPVYRIDVAELPKVKRIDLTYHYPARLALTPRTVVDGGDIRAVRGSRVVITVVPSQDVGNANLVLDGHETLPMAKNEDGHWRAELAISEEGQYRIDLPYREAVQIAASPSYAIEVLPDRAPAVKLTRFGRDSQVTSVEEALLEITGNDDLNIATLELIYAINDQPETTVVLYQGGQAKTEVSAEHMLALEDYALSPGDLVAYYARAADSHGEDALTSTSDIFFMEIRPFDRHFRRAQGGGGAGGMQGGDQERSLSHQQRELVIATFKLARDAQDYEQARFAETADALETAQARIRSRVQAIIRRIGTRQVMQKNPGIQRMREELPQAVAAMTQAQQHLLEESPVEALPPARKALQHLQRAEAAFRDARLAFGQSSGRGAREAEDLANLFRLEMDKLRNKYESVRHGNWQQGSQQLDEALEKLKALARRQQQEIERLERRAALAPDAPSGSGSQRALAAELEDMVRRLERLSREQRTPELENLTRQAKAAAEAMRRAGAKDGKGVADARAALDRLKNIQRLADSQPQQQLRRSIDNASRRTERLAREHEGIGAGMAALPEDEDSRKKSTSSLQSRKLRMAEEVGDLESDLRRLARDASKEKPEASRALRGAADAIDKDDLVNTIEQSAAAIDGPGKDPSRRVQAAIGESLERVGEGLAEAAKSVDQSQERERARSLAQMRELVEGLESLEGRTLQRSRAGRAKADGARSAWGTADGQSSMGRDLDPTDMADMADLRRDFAQRRRTFERLAEVMTSDEHGAKDIGRLLGEMREIEQDSAFDDLQRQRQLIAGLKELEMRLHGDPDEDETRPLFLPAQDSVPSQYRLQVDEYFRGLSRVDSTAVVAD